MCNCGRGKAKRRTRPKSRLIKGSNHVVAVTKPERKEEVKAEIVLPPETGQQDDTRLLDT